MKHTSYKAYQGLVDSGRKATLKSRVYGFIHDNPGTTQRDITERLGESARKRVADLLKELMIWESGTKKIDNREYTTYVTHSEALQQSLFRI